jgi:hypothetical protein
VLVEGLGCIILGVDDEGVGADPRFVARVMASKSSAAPSPCPLAAVATASRPSRIAGIAG